MVYKVLTVDDDFGFTTLIKLILEKEGEFEVRMENDSNHAVDAALAFMPDVILMDIVMPGLDGHGVVAQLQSDPELRDIPVIMLTAMMSPEEAGNEGFAPSLSHRVLPKPVNVKTLKRCLYQVVGAPSGF